jgi:hypothetical protein
MADSLAQAGRAKEHLDPNTAMLEQSLHDRFLFENDELGDLQSAVQVVEAGDLVAVR